MMCKPCRAINAHVRVDYRSKTAAFAQVCVCRATCRAENAQYRAPDAKGRVHHAHVRVIYRGASAALAQVRVNDTPLHILYANLCVSFVV